MDEEQRDHPGAVKTATRRVVNKVRNRADMQRRPVSEDQATTPIADAIEDYWKRGNLAFNIPAHGGGIGPQAEVTKWAGEQVLRADVSPSHGLDRRDRAWAVQQTAQDLFADAVGADMTLFSTNGSSMSVHVALLTLAGEHQPIVLARNGHKSVFSGLILSGAVPHWVDPNYDEELELAHPATAEAVEAGLDAHPDAKAAMIFNPSYYGTVVDVAAIADVCHARGLPLATDDAWGLDYAFGDHPDLPKGSLAQGTDLAIGSVHKSLTGLGQTSVLSIQGDLIDQTKLQLCFELEESTSASALLLSSIDGARAQFVRDGRVLHDRAMSATRLLRERLAAEVPELRVITPEELRARPGVVGADPTHVMIETAPIGVTGYAFSDALERDHHITVELADHRRIMPIVTFAHDESHVDRLVTAIRAVVDAKAKDGRTEVPQLPSRTDLRTEQAMRPRDAFFSDAELVSTEKAVGRISAEMVTPYPPGIPAIAPGEVINQAIVDYLTALSGIGAFFEGAADPSLKKMRVVIPK